MKGHMRNAGGKMAPAMTKKAESKTARPVKQAVLSKPNETGRRMMEKTGKRGGKW
jgi:hypothetical protein